MNAPMTSEGEDININPVEGAPTAVEAMEVETNETETSITGEEKNAETLKESSDKEEEEMNAAKANSGNEAPEEAKSGQEDQVVANKEQDEEEEKCNDESTSRNTSDTEEEEPDADKNDNGDDNSNDDNVSDDPTELMMKAVTHKDEGNNHFKSGDLTKASRSYRKGTSLLKNLNKENTGDEQVKALLINLQTNLSMVCFKQNKHQQSRDVASKAIDIDSTNVKALYRRAIACRKLGDVDSARKDLKLALKQDPKNRAVQKELLSIKKQLEVETKKKKAALSKAFSSKGGSFLYNDKEEEEKKKAEQKKLKEEAEKKAREKRKADWEDECVARMSRGDDAITFEDYEKDLKKKEEDAEKARKKAKKEEEDRREAERRAQRKERKQKQHESDDDDEDELTEKELQMLRGYKKTSDGRTTSYFNREQTEEEKKLLGNIAPQRLNTAPAPQRLDSAASNKSSSAWNQAGTWEEKDTSEWCTATLKKHLKEACVETGTFVASVSKVDSLSGEASVAFVSGKKRYVFDYHATVNYKIHDGEDNKVASGTLKLPDISSTAISDELDVEISSWKAPSAENVENAVKCRDDLINQIRSQVILFVNLFNAQY